MQWSKFFVSFFLLDPNWTNMFGRRYRSWTGTDSIAQLCATLLVTVKDEMSSSAVCASYLRHFWTRCMTGTNGCFNADKINILWACCTIDIAREEWSCTLVEWVIHGVWRGRVEGRREWRKNGCLNIVSLEESIAWRKDVVGKNVLKFLLMIGCLDKQCCHNLIVHRRLIWHS